MRTLALILCSCLPAWPQAASADPQTLQNLLSEVRQLRIVLERSAAIAPRIQIAVERLKLQQEQVARTSRELSDLRDRLDHSRSEFSRIQQRAQSLEASETQETDASKRHDLDEALKMTKLDGEQTEKSTQQMQAHESELAGQLQSEQSRLTELNDRLDQIERALNVQ
jgi:DNA repair exonuclease SbcCD ATPase subunit